jgi:hypothetical protein
MRAGAVLTFVVGVMLAASCGGESSSDGGDSASGNGGTGTGGGDGNCNDERRALHELIDANKTCSGTPECITLTAGCGVTEDDCTGAVYTNDDVDQAEFAALRSELVECVTTHEGAEGCAICERVPLPPACREGRCIGASECGQQAAALWDFKARNDACETSDDCVTEYVGCDVTEDDCTGAVYFAADFDRVEFERLRDEYHACAGTCGACRRLPSPPGCVSGHCRILPIR